MEGMLKRVMKRTLQRVLQGIGRILKPVCIAFSMFSTVPVPHFEWQEEDMKYMMVFFPPVGILIGAAFCMWALFCQEFPVGRACFSLTGAAIPLCLSGGIHVDGYMDTMDALHSFQDRERKLEIMKDAHIGAFSVIRLLLYYLVYIAACSEIKGWRALLLLAGGFYLSRILSALAVVTFPCARENGLGHQFAAGAEKTKVKVLLLLQLALCSVGMLLVSPFAGTSVLFGGGLSLLYYRKTSQEAFGGVTGDTAGYFTVLCEGITAVLLALMCILGLC